MFFSKTQGPLCATGCAGWRNVPKQRPGLISSLAGRLEACCHLIGRDSGGVARVYRKRSVLAVNRKDTGEQKTQSVKKRQMKDKAKVSTSQSVWCLAFGRGFGREREKLIQLDRLCV